MGKNGGQPTDTILTLEEALRRFKRKRSEVGVQNKDQIAPDLNVSPADSSATVEQAGENAEASVLKPEEASAEASAQRDDVNAGASPSADIVALIEGVPCTLEQLEKMAAAEEAYQQDFPIEAEQDDAEIEDEPEVYVTAAEAVVARHALRRDYAFTAMGTALMVLVAFLVTRAPMAEDRPNLVAQNIATPALKASSMLSAAEMIANLVIMPDVDEQLASAGMPKVKTAQIEARIKDTLKGRAFTDIGVSVSKQGDAYLAGDVYSLNEAHKIAQIVHSVNGVARVHFLHPDVLPANGPAYFGVTTAYAPEVWGAKVRAVFIGSPADKAGIKPGDVISEFDGKTVPDGKTFNDLIAQYSPGQRVQFRVWHEGQPEYLVARLGELTTVASR